MRILVIVSTLFLIACQNATVSVENGNVWLDGKIITSEGGYIGALFLKDRKSVVLSQNAGSGEGWLYLYDIKTGEKELLPIQDYRMEEFWNLAAAPDKDAFYCLGIKQVERHMENEGNPCRYDLTERKISEIPIQCLWFEVIGKGKYKGCLLIEARATSAPLHTSWFRGYWVVDDTGKKLGFLGESESGHEEFDHDKLIFVAEPVSPELSMIEAACQDAMTGLDYLKKAESGQQDMEETIKALREAVRQKFPSTPVDTSLLPDSLAEMVHTVRDFMNESEKYELPFKVAGVVGHGFIRHLSGASWVQYKLEIDVLNQSGRTFTETELKKEVPTGKTETVHPLFGNAYEREIVEKIYPEVIVTFPDGVKKMNVCGGKPSWSFSAVFYNNVWRSGKTVRFELVFENTDFKNIIFEYTPVSVSLSIPATAKDPTGYIVKGSMGKYDLLGDWKDYAATIK